MPCNHPFKAFKTGYKTEAGKDDLIIAFDDVESGLLDFDRCKKPIDKEHARMSFVMAISSSRIPSMSPVVTALAAASTEPASGR